jgi:hypothetical protein
MRHTDHIHAALFVLTTVLLAGSLFGPHAGPSAANSDGRAVPESHDGAQKRRVIDEFETPHACRAGNVCPPG